MHFAHYSHGILKSVSWYVFPMYTALCMPYRTLLTIGRSLCDLAALICTYGLNKIDCSESYLGIVSSLVLPSVSFSICGLKVDLQQRIEVLWTNKHIHRLLHKRTYSHVHYSQNVQ